MPIVIGITSRQHSNKQTVEYNPTIWASNSKNPEAVVSREEALSVIVAAVEVVAVVADGVGPSIITEEGSIRVLPPMLSPTAPSSTSPRTTSLLSAPTCRDSPNSTEECTLRINQKWAQWMRFSVLLMPFTSVSNRQRVWTLLVSRRDKSSIWPLRTCSPLIASPNLRHQGPKVLPGSSEQVERDRNSEVVVDLVAEEGERFVGHPGDVADRSAADDGHIPYQYIFMPSHTQNHQFFCSIISFFTLSRSSFNFLAS